MRKGKMVVNGAVVGGTIVSCETWGPIVVEKDGVRYEIRVEEGHSGPETNVYKA